MIILIEVRLWQAYFVCTAARQAEGMRDAKHTNTVDGLSDHAHVKMN